MNLARLKAIFLETLFPPRCLSCKKSISSGTALCRECEEKIEINNSFFCPQCDRRLPAGKKGLPEPKIICHPNAKFLLAAVTSYRNGVARELIHALKYRRLKVVLPSIDKITGDYLGKINLSALTIGNWTIIPIPLYFWKERGRGFNQAALISGVLKKKLNFPVELALKRIRNTSPQVELKNYEARAKNLEGAFSINETIGLEGKNAIVVDDVFTSGATMLEAVKILKIAGVRKIIGFVIAKA